MVLGGIELDFLVNYILETLFAILSGSILYLYKKMKDYHKLILSTKNGVQALLKSKIIEKYIEYRKNGCVSIHDQEMINELYTEYKILGGNGIIERLVDDIAEMEVNRCLKGGD